MLSTPLSLSLRRLLRAAPRTGFFASPAVAVVLALLAIGLALYGAQAGQASWEVEITRSIQSWSPSPLRAVAHFMTDVGNSPVYPLTAIAATLALLLTKHRSLALLAATATVLRSLSPLLKELVDRERPSAALVDVSQIIPNPSFPSGHVLGATLLYGVLVYAVELAVPVVWLRRALQGLLVSLILLMGYARVELGEHWPSDVLGAWAVGLLLLWLLTRVHCAMTAAPAETSVPAR